VCALCNHWLMEKIFAQTNVSTSGEI
jgi:hypothetical protein